MNSKVDKFSGRDVCLWENGIKKPNIHHVARNDIIGNHKPSYSS